MDLITLSKCEVEIKVEPPIMMAEDPEAAASFAIFEAAEEVTFSGSMRVMCMAPFFRI